MFSEFEHDFGTVVKGEEAEHRFELQNVYEEDIEIASVSSSCGCTSVSFTNKVLKTWEKSEIIAKFNTIANYVGARKATITVRFAKPFVGEMQLNVRGTIRGDIQVEPGHVDFGTVAPASTPAKKIVVAKAGNPAWKIVDVRSSFPHIAVSLATSRQFGQVQYVLTARLKETVPTGFVQGELVAIAEDGMKVPIQFSAKVVTPLQISPSVLDLPNVNVGETVRRKIVLKAEKPFTIVDVTCDDGSFAVESDGAAKTIHMVDVSYTGAAGNGRQETKLHFITDLAEQKTIELPAIFAVQE